MTNNIIPFLKLGDYLKEGRRGKRSLVLVGGCFDILHPGHVEFLQKSGEYGDVLVLLESDGNVRMRKGEGRPIHSQKDRARVVGQIAGVESVLLLPDIQTDSDYFELVKRIQPDIIGITEGDPYTEHMRRQANAAGAKLVSVMLRIDKHSTQGIIERVRNL